MPHVSFTLADGTTKTVDAKVGSNVMRAATENGIPGIVADCGGGLACATCHVFVDAEFLALMPPLSANEDQMLEHTMAGRASNSRLSCQIILTDEMDGLRVRVADPQV